MKLQPFTDKATCPKCQTGWAAHRAKPRYCKSESEFSGVWLRTPEHLRCTCEECGYEWLMECADAEKMEPSPECDGPPESVTIKETIVSHDCPHRTKCVEQVFKEFSKQLRGY